MKHSISTEISISASPSVIWEKLTNISNYPEWNPFITKLEGEMREGGRLEAEIGGMKFKPLILTYMPNEELKWMGRLILPGLFDGEHHFQIKNNGDGSCTFIQSENFSGLLVGLFKKKLDTETVEGFKGMNEALKEKCEGVGILH